jgi:hypothetical protein
MQYFQVWGPSAEAPRGLIKRETGRYRTRPVPVIFPSRRSTLRGLYSDHSWDTRYEADAFRRNCCTAPDCGVSKRHGLAAGHGDLSTIFVLGAEAYLFPLKLSITIPAHWAGKAGLYVFIPDLSRPNENFLEPVDFFRNVFEERLIIYPPIPFTR